MSFRSQVAHFRIALLASIGLVLANQPALSQQRKDLTDIFFRPVQKMIEPEFKSVEEREEYVERTMKRVQAAVERYSSHHAGRFPKKVDDSLMSFMMFGECDDKRYNAFSIPFNPFAGRREKPVNGTIKNPAEARSAPPGRMKAGSVEYSITSDGKDYAIRGGGRNNRALSDPRNKRRTYVLSHDPVEAVKANMRTVQWAAEFYAESHRGVFPQGIDHEFKCYFPGGNAKTNKQGSALPNPYTGKLEWPVKGSARDIKSERVRRPGPIKPGVIEYNSVNFMTNYVIRGGDGSGRAIFGLNGPNSTFVVARDGDGGKDQ